MKTITLNITLPGGALVTVEGSFEYDRDESPLKYSGPAERLIPFMLKISGLDVLPATDTGYFFLLGWKFLEIYGCKIEVIESGEWEYDLMDFPDQPPETLEP
jgi:hypothetical protein